MRAANPRIRPPARTAQPADRSLLPSPGSFPSTCLPSWAAAVASQNGAHAEHRDIGYRMSDPTTRCSLAALRRAPPFTRQERASPRSSGRNGGLGSSRKVSALWHLTSRLLRDQRTPARSGGFPTAHSRSSRLARLPVRSARRMRPGLCDRFVGAKTLPCTYVCHRPGRMCSGVTRREGCYAGA